MKQTSFFSTRLPILPIAAALACVLLVLPVVAQSASTPILSDREQADLSTAVVVAEVGRGQLAIDEHWNRAVARTPVQVVDVISGKAPTTLVVEQFVGRQGKVHYHLPGDARLSEGERCVLFLREVGGQWYLTAMELSHYRIVRSKDGDRVQREVRAGILGGERGDDKTGAESENTVLALRRLDDLRQALATKTTDPS